MIIFNTINSLIKSVSNFLLKYLRTLPALAEGLEGLLNPPNVTKEIRLRSLPKKQVPTEKKRLSKEYALRTEYPKLFSKKVIFLKMYLLQLVLDR